MVGGVESLPICAMIRAVAVPLNGVLLSPFASFAAVSSWDWIYSAFVSLKCTPSSGAFNVLLYALLLYSARMIATLSLL